MQVPSKHLTPLWSRRSARRLLVEPGDFGHQLVPLALRALLAEVEDRTAAYFDDLHAELPCPRDGVAVARAEGKPHAPAACLVRELHCGHRRLRVNPNDREVAPILRELGRRVLDFASRRLAARRRKASHVDAVELLSHACVRVVGIGGEEILRGVADEHQGLRAIDDGFEGVHAATVAPVVLR